MGTSSLVDSSSFDLLRETLDTGWGWPLDGVQVWFEDLWNYVAEVGQDVINAVVQPVEKFVSDSLSGAKNWAVGILDAGFKGVADIGKGLEDIISDTAAWTANAVTSGIGSLFSSAATSIGGAVNTGLAPLSAIGTGLGGIFTFLQGLPQAIRDWLAKFFGRFQPHSPGILEDIINYIIETLSGKTYRKYMDARVETLGYDQSNQMRDLMKLWKPIGDLVLGMFSPIFDQISDRAKVPVGSPPDVVQKYALDTVKLMISVMAPFLIAMVAGELIHPMKELGLNQVSAMLWDISGFRRISADIMGALIYPTTVLPLENAMFKLVQPKLPREYETIQMTSRGVMTMDQFHETTRNLGYSDYWGDLFWASHWQPMRFQDLQTMLWRGAINQAQFSEALHYAGYQDTYISGYAKMIEELPRSTDLIQFVVHEVIPPSEFYDTMTLQGYSSHWSNAYWENHWRLADASETRTAMHRGVITKEDYRKFLVLQDYKPEPRPGISKADRDIMDEISYDLPGRIEMRWLARWGLIDRNTMTDMELKRGIHPDWADRVAESEWQNMLLDERTRLVTDLRSLLKAGYINRTTFQNEVTALKFSPHEITLILRAVDMELIQDRNEEALKLQTALFVRKQITLEQYQTELGKLGLSQDRISYLTNIAQLQIKSVEPPLLTKDEITAFRTSLVYRFKQGYIDEAALNSWLTKLGFTAEEIDLTVERAKAEYDSDWRADLLTQYKATYQKGEVDESGLYNLIKSIVPVEERARTLVEIEQLKKLAKPKTTTEAA